ncbi:MAG: DUF5105 domain-containing protein [Firmicutes bacterium]|uniref:DUF5105 domain-containing protein n=1 Tax=Candidatus Gallilactobacillus intestinavium TaxID=2840838 RepID=A0A9D9H7D8_9LACO|nr:DUF5105 domain-containing protein [Candidatus Gallilactobacillus intestinavium]
MNKLGKRIVIGTVLGISVLTLSACGNHKTNANPHNGNQISIKSGSYIVPEYKHQLSKGYGYLALHLSIKNNGKKEMLTDDNFKLVDKSGDVTKPTDVYDGQDKTLSVNNLDHGEKLANAELVFKVNKNKNYTLKLEPDDKDVPTSSISIKANKYHDDSNGAIAAAKAYVNTVFLNENDKNYDKFVANDKNQVKNDFNNAAKKHLNDDILNFLSDSDSNKIDDNTQNNLVNQLQKANATRGKVTYQIKKASGKDVKVQLNVKSINLTDVGDNVIKNNTNSQDFVKNFGNTLNGAKISHPDDVLTVLKLTKDGNKWKIDTSNNGDIQYKDVIQYFFGEDY